jgi:Kef-type K+ transport system membrane component KefB
MNARGAMEMILASVALEFGLIDQRIFVALVTMALVTSMMTGPLLQWLLRFPLPVKTEGQSPDEFSLP